MTNGGHPSYSTAKENLRATRILFSALVAGVLMFMLVVVVLVQLSDSFKPAREHSNVFLWGAAGMALICWLFARQAYARGIVNAKNLTGSVNDKLNYHRSFFIRYMALCEAGALCSLISFFVTGDFRLFVVMAVMLTAMLVAMPTRKKIVSDLCLDWQEEQEL